MGPPLGGGGWLDGCAPLCGEVMDGIYLPSLAGSEEIEVLGKGVTCVSIDDLEADPVSRLPALPYPFGVPAPVHYISVRVSGSLPRSLFESRIQRSAVKLTSLYYLIPISNCV